MSTESDSASKASNLQQLILSFSSHPCSGTDPNATLGPLMSARGVDKVQQHIEQAQKLGAKIEWQAKKEDFLSSKDFEPGYFVPPTIISGLTDKMDIWQEEVSKRLPCLALRYDRAAKC